MKFHLIIYKFKYFVSILFVYIIKFPVSNKFKITTFYQKHKRKSNNSNDGRKENEKKNKKITFVK